MMIQETQRAPNKMNPNKHTPGHVIKKMAKKLKKRDSKGSKTKAKSKLQRNSCKAVS